MALAWAGREDGGGEGSRQKKGFRSATAAAGGSSATVEVVELIGGKGPAARRRKRVTELVLLPTNIKDIGVTEGKENTVLRTTRSEGEMS